MSIPGWCKRVPIERKTNGEMVEFQDVVQTDAVGVYYVTDNLINNGYLYKPGDVILCWELNTATGNFSPNIFRIEACIVQWDKVNSRPLLIGYETKSMDFAQPYGQINDLLVDDYEDYLSGTVNMHLTPERFFRYRMRSQDDIQTYLVNKWSENMVDKYDI